MKAKKFFKDGFVNLLNALPVIIFFLLIFSIIIDFFGLTYILIATLVTLLFQENYNKQKSIFSLLSVCILQTVLLLLAYVATLSIYLTVILNIIIPFWLIFSKSNQFNKSGYFSSLMTFTFLQLSHIPFNTGAYNFIANLYVMLTCLAIFLISTLICNLYFKFKIRKKNLEKDAFNLMIKALENKTNNVDNNEILDKLLTIQNKYYKEVYAKRSKKNFVSKDGKVKYLFALMLQRFIYYISSYKIENTDLTPLMIEYTNMVISVFRKSICDNFLAINHQKLINESKKIMDIANSNNETYFNLVSRFFRLYVQIIEELDTKKRNKFDVDWIVPRTKRFTLNFKYQFKIDSFELRFALRMVTVLLITLIYNFIAIEYIKGVAVRYSYWLALNSFMILRPMYEESVYRMKYRLLGTILGSIILSFILPLFGSNQIYHILFAAVTVIGIYALKPGSLLQSSFVTLFTLTLTTISTQAIIALPSRLVYVLIAVIIVLVVNKFLFPTSFKTQFRYNIMMLFHMQFSYLRLLKESASKHLQTWRLCDVQMNYNIINQELKSFVNTSSTFSIEEKEEYNTLFDVMWKMIVEMEQILFFVNVLNKGLEEKNTLVNYVNVNLYVLGLSRNNIKTDKENYFGDLGPFKRTISNELELSDILVKYSKNMSKLYNLSFNIRIK